MNLTPQIIEAACGSTQALSSTWLAPLQAASVRFSINTSLRIAAWLASVGVESANLTATSEDLNYSAQGLATTWPNRYAVDEHAATKVPNALANKLARNPEAIANNVYASRNGNGDEASGNGWQYRGRGPIGITGLTNYTLCGMVTELDLIEHPELLEQPGAGAMSSGWFWSNSDLNALADAGQFLAICKSINLGNPNSTGTPNGLAARQALYAAGLKALGA